MSSGDTPSLYSKHRIEALSDGIFAIAMTLLVLDLKVPVAFAPGHLGEALLQDRESWMAFGLTFAIAARYWMLQHRVFELTEHIHQQTLVLTFFFLGFIAVLPFSTALIGRHGSERVAVLIYCVNQAAIGAMLIVKLEYVRITARLPGSPQLAKLRHRLWSLAGTMTLGALATAFLPLRYIFVALAVLILGAGRLRLPRKPGSRPLHKPRRLP